MFATHQPLIADHAQTPEGFADVVTFVIATINQHFAQVGTILDHVYAQGLDAPCALTASQRHGIAYVRSNAERVLCQLNTCRSPIDGLRLLVELPSIGIVKAGFILQLGKGQVGCLDRHNLRAGGLAERAFHRVPQSAEALTTRLEVYYSVCAALGTPARLYDGWCTLIAAKYPRDFTSAEHVSECHVRWCRALGL